jgi:hypothetical protein
MRSEPAGRCRRAKESVPEGTSENRCEAPACGSLGFLFHRMGNILEISFGVTQISLHNFKVSLQGIIL